MKFDSHWSHVSGGIEFSFQIIWQDKHIGVYAVSITLARWCWTLELDTQVEKPRLK
jgi:hypothetical protein